MDTKQPNTAEIIHRDLNSDSHKIFPTRDFECWAYISDCGEPKKRLSELVPQWKCAPPSPNPGLEPGTNWGESVRLKLALGFIKSTFGKFA